jgi:GTPase
LETTKAPTERVLLVGLARGRRERPAAEESLRELRELASSAGGEVVGFLMQERSEPDPAVFVGRGKLEEIKAAVFAHDVDLIVFDDELSPAQQRNIEGELDVRVIDRSELILDIFAQRARSREGKLQVELAMLDYRLPRLTGRGVELSRLGGGIGTRGPGETKLEADRRTVRRRMSRIRSELADLEDRRTLQRRKRQGVPIPTLSLVGYTNAGKSTLFNRLAAERTFVSSRLFATLDPLVRRMALPSGQEVLIGDTVGFIRKLPHALIAAFEATLEETLEADLLLHVIDVSDPAWERLRSAVYEVLEEIGANVPILEVYNKADRLPGDPPVPPPAESVLVSALTGRGIDELLIRVEDRISRDYVRVAMCIPFDRGEVLAGLRERGRVESTKYGPDGIHVSLAVRRADLGRYREFLTE